LQYNTVRIEVKYKDGKTGIGTGFFFTLVIEEGSFVPVIITNKHVVEDSETGLFYMSLKNKDGTPMETSHTPIKFMNFEKMWHSHPDPQIDLVAMPINPLLVQAEKNNLPLFFIPLGEDLMLSKSELSELTAVEDILMVGYPIGIWDKFNNAPVFRQGITATHPAKDYNGKKEFMVDIACFPGSSGSPVFLFNLGSYAKKGGGTVLGTRFKFLGVLYGGPQYTATGEIKIVEVPTKHIPIVKSSIPINLGIVIKSEMILDFKELFKKIIQEK
jgi:hypothetical protein